LTLAPGSFVLVASNVAAFIARYGALNTSIPGTVLAGKFKGGLGMNDNFKVSLHLPLYRVLLIDFALIVFDLTIYVIG